LSFATKPILYHEYNMGLIFRLIHQNEKLKFEFKKYKCTRISKKCQLK